MEAKLAAGTSKRLTRPPEQTSISKVCLSSAPSSSTTSETISATKLVSWVGEVLWRVGLF